MKGVLASFASGLLFAVGLGVSGMTRPSKVIGFLDVGGAWDPSLGFVMAGAVLAAIVAYRLARRLPAPLWGDRFVFPRETRIDRRLVVGAAIFGVGWGLSGYCPGPAIVGLGRFSAGPLLFVGGMVAGMQLVRWLDRRGEPADAPSLAVDETCG